MTQPRWVRFSSFAGFMARGTGGAFEAPVEPLRHIDRAVWLAGQLEAPTWGTVQGYDGCGMSGGIIHHIAVGPRDLSQGSFFPLLRRVFDHLDATSGAPVNKSRIELRLDALGYQLGRDGKIRTKAGELLPGRDVRGMLGARDGNTARKGADADKALWWTTECRDLLSHPSTRKPQSDYAALWLAQGNSSLELGVYRRFSRLVRLDAMLDVEARSLPPEVDLAMCIYHAFSVNGPAPAAAVLKAVEAITDPMSFSKRLVRGLGKRQFGRWQDEPGDGGNRYDKTRRAALRFWPKDLVAQIAPVDL